MEEVLDRWRGRSVYFARYVGNNGDRLIELATRSLLARFGLTLAPRPEAADAIVLKGGAAVTARYGGLPWAGDLARAHPSQPLLLLPSTFDLGGEREAFLAAVRSRQAPTFLFAREERSYGELLAAGLASLATVGLDHDTSFYLKGSDFLAALSLRGRAKHVLVVERTDVDGLTGRKELGAFLERPQPPLVRAVVPAPFRKVVRELLAAARRQAFRAGALRRAETPFVQKSLSVLFRDEPAWAPLPVVAADISQTSLCSFATFCRLIADAAAIVSTRLHVAILAAMLGKPTYLVPGPNAGIRGVYEYSLASMENVRLLS